MNKKFKLLLKRIKPVTDQFPDFWKHVQNKNLDAEKDELSKYMDKGLLKSEYNTSEFKISILNFAYVLGFVRSFLYGRISKTRKFKIQIKN
jgi:hypothetical protein